MKLIAKYSDVIGEVACYCRKGDFISAFAVVESFRTDCDFEDTLNTVRAACQEATSMQGGKEALDSLKKVFPNSGSLLRALHKYVMEPTRLRYHENNFVRVLGDSIALWESLSQLQGSPSWALRALIGSMRPTPSQVLPNTRFLLESLLDQAKRASKSKSDATTAIKRILNAWKDSPLALLYDEVVCQNEHDTITFILKKASDDSTTFCARLQELLDEFDAHFAPQARSVLETGSLYDNQDSEHLFEAYLSGK